VRSCVVAIALAACNYDPQAASPSDGPPGDTSGPTDSTDASIDGDSAARITEGLLALYTFEEGSGTTVADRSGVGAALDLVIQSEAAVTWSPGRLTLDAETLVASPGPATKIRDACRDADAFTLEAWISPTVVGGFFPRVVTLSITNTSLAMALLAIDDHFEFRMLGSQTDANGLPSLNSPAGTVAVAPIHVVLVSEPGGMRRIYVGGIERGTDLLGGDLSSWGNIDFRLGLGNEIDGARPWLGTFDLVAIYGTPLSAADVLTNFVAGPE
jgi:hypothetical protein